MELIIQTYGKIMLTVVIVISLLVLLLTISFSGKKGIRSIVGAVAGINITDHIDHQEAQVMNQYAKILFPKVEAIGEIHRNKEFSINDIVCVADNKKSYRIYLLSILDENEQDAIQINKISRTTLGYVIHQPGTYLFLIRLSGEKECLVEIKKRIE